MKSYVKIRAELDSDPILYPSANSDQQIADELNNLNKIQNRGFLERAEVIEAFDSDELVLLSGDDIIKVFEVLSDVVDPVVVAAQYAAIFPSGAKTIISLAALGEETVSRAEQLGFGKIEREDIRIARAQ